VILALPFITYYVISKLIPIFDKDDIKFGAG
jgi:hypothetical protein